MTLASGTKSGHILSIIAEHAVWVWVWDSGGDAQRAHRHIGGQRMAFFDFRGYAVPWFGVLL